MADTVLTKKITDLPEGTEINDADLIMTGVNGTASLRKNKWSKFVEKLRAVLFVDSCSSTSAEYGLTAKQGKNLQDQIDTIKDQYDELNTSKVSKDNIIIQTKSGNVSASSGAGTATINVSMSEYKAIGIVGFSIASTYYAPSAIDFNANEQTVTAKIRHVSDNAASGSVTVYVMVLYIKN